MLAAGAVPDTELAAALQGMVARVVSVGDCAEPRSIREAVEEGYRAGLEI